MNFPQSFLGASALTLCLIASTSINAQITIESSDLPQPDVAYVLQESTPDPLADYASSGADHTWDFSQLDSNSEIPFMYSSIESAPTLAQFSFNNEWTNPDYYCQMFGEGEFPDISQFGIELPVEIGDLYNYYQTEGSSFNIAGISMNLQGIDVPLEYTDIDEIHPLPLNYGDDVVSTSAYEVAIPDQFSYATTGSRVGEVDGWGTLLLPNGAEHEVLRLATTISKSDEISIQGGEAFPIEYETTVYQWLSNDGGMPILEVQAVFGAAFRVRFQGEAAVEDTTGIDDLTGINTNDINIYPNPATAGSAITIEGMNSSSTWEVRDTAGNICLTGQGASIESSSLAKGAYFFIQKSNTSGLVARPTIFIVQ
jgi:hypothetical protein